MTAGVLDRPAVPDLAGACLCGCGSPAPIARRTDTRRGVVKGRPQSYIKGHNASWARAMISRPARRREVPSRRVPPMPAPGPWAWLCSTCPWPLVSQKAQREPGFRVHAGRGLCDACSRRARLDGTIADHGRRTWSRDELLDEWEILRGRGHHRQAAAELIGMSLATFERALRRAAGDRRAVWDVR